MKENSHPRSRWFRFSLRTLLLLVTVLGVWLGLHMQAVRRQKESIAAIKNVGGWCYYDFQADFSLKSPPDIKAISPVPSWLRDWLGDDFFHNITYVDLTTYHDAQGRRQANDRGTGDDLKYLSGFPNLKTIVLNDKQASSMGLFYVGKMNRLEVLAFDIENTNDVTDESLAHLSNLNKLWFICITKSQITDESLKTFAKMPSLRYLLLEDNHFTDQGLAHLRDMVQLELLAIGSDEVNDITDEGLIHLKGLRNLTDLDLRGTKVTAAGLEKHLKGLKKLTSLETDLVDVSSLEAALPNCKISHKVAIQPATSDE